MAMHDLEDLDALWRNALEQLAPVAGEPAPERVQRRVVVRRRRRWTVGGALICIPLLVAAPLLLFRPRTEVRTVNVSARPAPTPPLITAVLDDSGLNFTPSHVPGGSYRLRFLDQRARPRSPATFTFVVAGVIPVMSVRSGETQTVDLTCGSQLGQGLLFGSERIPRETTPALTIEPSKACTTPVT